MRVNSGSGSIAYRGGDERAFCIVRVPTAEEEMRRARVRQRNTLMRERVQMSLRGRAILLYHGVKTAREWWRPLHWQALARSLPLALCDLVRPWREMILELRTRQLALEKEIVRAVDRSKVPARRRAWLGGAIVIRRLWKSLRRGRRLDLKVTG